jgi:Glycosyltransferase family 87
MRQAMRFKETPASRYQNALDSAIFPPLRPRTAIPATLRGFLVVNLSLSILCVSVEFICAFVLHLSNPYNWPLTPPHELLNDLNTFVVKFDRFHSPSFFTFDPEFPFAYPAPMAVLYKLIYLFPWHRNYSFFLLMAATIAGSALLVAFAAVRRGLELRPALLFCGFTVLFSYPFIFEAKQGNLEFFVAVLISAGIWLFLRGRGYSSAACFAVAGSMKLFPLIYLGLHIAQRRWKPVVFGIAVAIVITLFSLWLLAVDISLGWHKIQEGIAVFQEKIVLHILPREVGFDHSMFSVVKRICAAVNPEISLRSALRYYMIVVATGGTVLFFTRIRHLPIANQVLTLAVCSIMLPPVSYDYTLMHLYAPLAMVTLIGVSANKRNLVLPGLLIALVLIAVALAPLSEFIHHGVRFGGQIRAIVLLALLIVGLLYPFPAEEREAEAGFASPE